ncbi:hypothetical protein [Kordia jejudonensis]|uniref:hypothetical protein n=1 Tax=Kordia jejudonensis TaxID=1348245 RepID=UPI000629710A|nr:hypothetical protein [Kordia jejudonensis]
MKTLTFFNIILVMLLFASCNNDDDHPTNPVDQLPAATQTGENTFGCLLDGEVFLPGGGTNPLDCVYQFVDGGYYFALQGNKRDNNNIGLLIGIGTNNFQIFENQTYILTENTPPNVSGAFAFGGVFSYTSTTFTGELHITKLDETNQIVSGTFWFDVEDPISGEIREIREGRFDMQYTQ